MFNFSVMLRWRLGDWESYGTVARRLYDGYNTDPWTPWRLRDRAFGSHGGVTAFTERRVTGVWDTLVFIKIYITKKSHIERIAWGKCMFLYSVVGSIARYPVHRTAQSTTLHPMADLSITRAANCYDFGVAATLFNPDYAATLVTSLLRLQREPC